MNLFDAISSKQAPLAQRMRPESLNEFIGQRHIVGEGKLLTRAIMTNSLTSSIFFGPPGCGKTTLASIIANSTNSAFEKLNAVSDGVKEVREVLSRAQATFEMHGKATYLLLDECHRWNKSQSDSILPALEKGTIKFIGSTTENPMISMTPAIVSRCRIFQFVPLSIADVKLAISRALKDKKNGYGNRKVNIDEKAINHIATIANGDIRTALNALELAVLSTPLNKDQAVDITLEIAEQSIQQKIMAIGDEQYYNMLSAFCKSMRGSDSDAAIAWLARMLYAGVDPKIIVRRMIVHSSEDIGLADPNALVQAVSAMQALEFIGLPEARIPIIQALIYICEAPKSNSVVVALDRAFNDAKNTIDKPVPLHLRDTSYAGAEKFGNGKGYKYPHDFDNHFVAQQYMPQSVVNNKYYCPSDQGFEKTIKARQQQRKES